MYHFEVKHFTELSVEELYQILQLRQEIFIIEQNCIYPDIDGIDKQCYHVFVKAKDREKIIAYARLVPANLKFDVPSIGRVINDKNHRGKGLGKLLMQKAIDLTMSLFKTDSIKISAQTYLFKFYSELGFKAIGETYDEDGIEHVDMLFISQPA